MQDTKKKAIDYNFNNIESFILKQILSAMGFEKDYMILPFLGFRENIKTLSFQSETSNKAIVISGNKCLFVKEIPWYCTDKLYIEESYNRVYNLLRCFSDKIPKLYQNKNTKDSFVKIDTKFYIVMDYVEGNDWYFSETQAYNVASELAKIHNIPVKVKRRFYKDIYSSAKDMITLSKKNYLLKELKKYKACLKKYKKYKTLVYGDSIPSNYIFDNLSLKAIVDFDNVKYDNPVRDLAETIVSFSIVKYKNNTSSYEKIFNPINMKVATAILTGYQEALQNKKLFSNMLDNLLSSIKIILILYHALAFLKNSLYEEKYDIEAVRLDLLGNYIEQFLKT